MTHLRLNFASRTIHQVLPSAPELESDSSSLSLGSAEGEELEKKNEELRFLSMYHDRDWRIACLSCGWPMLVGIGTASYSLRSCGSSSGRGT